MVQIGVRPAVIALPGSPELAAGLDQVVLLDSVWGRHLSQSKPLWPLRVGKALAKALPASAPAVILHGLSNFNVPYRRGDPRIKRVVTVHDLIPLLDPSGVSKASHAQLDWLLPRALAAADQVVCVSQWTLTTVREKYPEIAGKCRVIANGCTTFVGGTPRSVAENLSLLTVARGETYKQLDLLVQIVRSLGKNAAAILVTDAKGADLARKVGKDLLANGSLTLRSNLNTSELSKLYGSADVYLHPSRYEGYCLPAADALAHGCPVVYQTGSAIDEVAGLDVGFGLSPGSSLSTWSDAVQRAAAFRRDPASAQRIAAHVGTLSTWKDAAAALKNLYYDLSKES